MRLPITIQINLAPNDYPLTKHLLKEQIEIFKDSVDEILLTVETKKSYGRFGANWEKYSPLLTALLNKIEANNLTIDEIDYSSEMKKKVANYFFDTNFIPEKDYRGGPFYCYFYGLYKAKNNLIFHLDSDMFLGGNSKKWIYEAYTKHLDDPLILTTSPLPGPPHHLEILKGQTLIEQLDSFTYLIQGFSTRIFTIDKFFFHNKKLTLSKTSFRNIIKALVRKQAPYELPEKLIAYYIKEHKLKRIDFLGQQPGLWSLHPPYKTDSFLKSIPKIIKSIKEKDLPEAQLGFYDIVDELHNWDDARKQLKANRCFKQFFKL